MDSRVYLCCFLYQQVALGKELLRCFLHFHLFWDFAYVCVYHGAGKHSTMCLPAHGAGKHMVHCTHQWTMMGAWSMHPSWCRGMWWVQWKCTVRRGRCQWCFCFFGIKFVAVSRVAHLAINVGIQHLQAEQSFCLLWFLSESISHCMNICPWHFGPLFWLMEKLGAPRGNPPKHWENSAKSTQTDPHNLGIETESFLL